MAFGFDSNKNNQPPAGSNPAPGNNNSQPSLPGTGAPGKWRAKVNCTYNGAYIRAGEEVMAAKMDNRNFEEVK